MSMPLQISVASEIVEALSCVASIGQRDSGFRQRRATSSVAQVQPALVLRAQSFLWLVCQ